MVEPVSAIIGLVALGGQLAIATHGFIERWKGCPQQVRQIANGLDSTVHCLDQITEALKHPAGTGIFSLEGKRNKFLPVIDGLTDVFNGIRKLIERYDGLDSTKLVTVFWKKGKWAVTGMDEAQRLAVELSQQKQALQLTLSVAQISVTLTVDS